MGSSSAPRGPKRASNSDKASSRKNTVRGLLHSIWFRRCGFCTAQALMAAHDGSVIARWSSSQRPTLWYGWPLCAAKATRTWRVTVRVERVDATQPVELRAFLQHHNDTVSETWTHLLLPE